MYNGELGPDAYAELEKLRNILADQHETVKCEHCQSTSGHFFHCPLINCEMAEIESAKRGQFSEPDKIIAHSLGVKLD